MFRSAIQQAASFLTRPQPQGGAAPAAIAQAPDAEASFQMAAAYLDQWRPSAALPRASAPTLPQGAAAPVPEAAPALQAAVPLALPQLAPPPPLPPPIALPVLLQAPAPATPVAPGPARAPFTLPDLPPVDASSVPDPAPVPVPGVKGKGPVLMQGHAGVPVRKMQQRLAALGFDPGPADGIFGPRTLAALKAYQAAQGLEADGVAGPKTWEALGVAVEGAPAQARRQGAVDYPTGPDGIVQTPDGPMVKRDGHLIAARIAEPFDKMVAAAREDGVTLSINSAYRSYAEQEVLWERFGHNTARVARPGTSHHQSGTAIDYANEGSAWSWLKQNATRFGFHNYAPEPWHYSLDGH